MKQETTASRGAVALVTGASSGIGRATAQLLAGAGFRVFGASRSAEGPEAVDPIALDVTDEASVADGVADIIRRAGRIDLLVNAAGFAIVGAIEDSSIAQVRALFETNVFGVMRVTRAVLPAMRWQGNGRILTISSVVGFVPAPFMGLYAASKHAVEGYAESLDHETRDLGVRSVLIEPGFVRTAITRNMPLPDVPIDAYERGRNGVREMIDGAVAGAIPPDVVAAVVLKAATTPNPRLRYVVGREAAALGLMRRLLPQNAFDRGLRKQFGIEGRQRATPRQPDANRLSPDPRSAGDAVDRPDRPTKRHA
jgi:NAD(P)-dependent dehydrogenase (short-subunit alcohol dehydrogenase family)